jgi:hypothetical protein
MRKIFVLYGLFLVFSHYASAQSDTASVTGVFDRITNEVRSYQIDTSQAPNDRTTKLILQIRSLRGGFNIDEAIAYKMGEEKKENKHEEAQFAYLGEQFRSGKAKQWLENAVVHIYRQHFSYKELKQITRFYKTSAGAKFANDFPYIMMKSLVAAQIIQEVIVKEMEPK